MVDPNRKINRLTDKDIEFLEECEREFASRFTEDDVEFMEYCLEPLDDPPILENINSGGGEFSRNESGSRYNNRNPRNRRGFGNRSNRGNFNDYNGPSNRHQPYKRTAFAQGDDSTSRPPIKIMKNYGNFVAASKDD